LKVENGGSQGLAVLLFSTPTFLRSLEDVGVDVNAANTDGRTALDAVKALRYETVVRFLAEKGARPGTRL